MQTPAEVFLINSVTEFLQRPSLDIPLILNIGANTSLVIENSLVKAGCKFQEDRTDVTDPTVLDSHVRRCIVSSVESMPMLNSQEYNLAFANFVFEHVPNVRAAASEVCRVLKPNGYFVLSTPNPAAPEFLLSKFTPHWFHQFIKGKGEGHEAHETHYSYKSITELINIFESVGFSLVKESFYPFTFGYLYRFPFFKQLSWLYDHIIKTLKIKRLMGNVGLVFEKTSK